MFNCMSGTVLKRAALALLLAFIAGASAAASAVRIPYEKYRLENGLEVILVEDRRLPLVAVNVWYHVGPANERPGRTGFAHLFEHMMFQGSSHVGDDGHFKLLEAAGASTINGSTDFDRTNYFQTVPANELELALWLESDRMGFLLPTLDEAKLENQIDVVRNERRQSFENRPYGLVGEALFHQLFPKGHPYHASIIGSHADLEAARLEDVRAFFEQYYVPNNASLAIVGDIDKVRARALVQKYFGSIARGAAVPKVEVEAAPIERERRVRVTDKVELPALHMAWHSAPVYRPGDAEADLLAHVLGGGKSSRLHQRLVYEKKIAQDVLAYQQSMSLGSVFVIEAIAKPGVQLGTLERAIDVELAQVREHGPSPAEMERARNTIESRMIGGLQSIGRIADRLNQYNHFVADPGYLESDLDRYRKADAAAVQRVARHTLRSDARVVVYGLPGEKQVDDVPKRKREEAPRSIERAAAPANAAARAPGADETWRKERPAAGPASKLTLPVPQRFELDNGLTVLLVERPGLPFVAASLVVKRGREANPAHKPGLAAFVADMLDEGTGKRSALEIADDLARMGATLATNSSSDSSTSSVTALGRHFGSALEVLSEVVLDPAFDAREIERVRHDRLTEVLQRRDNPHAIAQDTLSHALYGPRHPHGYSDLGTKQSLESISRGDLLELWRAAYTPGNAALLVSGDLSTSELRALAEEHFGAWKGAASRVLRAEPDRKPAGRIVVVDTGAAPQTALSIGQMAAARTDRDYVPLIVLNSALGGQFSSRINMNLRERNGYTYGARSQFSFWRGPSPFAVITAVRTDVTAAAVTQIIAEIERTRREEIAEQELGPAKDFLARSLPGLFDSSSSTVASLADLHVYGLPLDYYRTLPAKLNAVSAADVLRVARHHLDPTRLVVVAVGGADRIRAGLERLDRGEVEVVAPAGR